MGNRRGSTSKRPDAAERCSAVDALRESIWIEAEERHGRSEGKSVGHASDVGHCGGDCLIFAGKKPPRLGDAGDGVWVIGEVFDEGSKDFDHRVGLGHRGGSKVDGLVVECSETGEGLGMSRVHPDGTGGQRGRDDGVNERSELASSS